MSEYIFQKEDENVVSMSHGDQVEIEAPQSGYLDVAGNNGRVTQPWPRDFGTRVDASTG